MKKKTIICAICIILIALFLGIINYRDYIFKSSENDNDNDNSVLVESSYSNYAFGKVHKGTVICSNGKLYEFNGELNKTDASKSDNAKKKIKTVSESDLKLIKEYINNIENVYEEKSVGADMGSSCISIYNKGTRIILHETGDCERKIYR